MSVVSLDSRCSIRCSSVGSGVGSGVMFLALIPFWCFGSTKKACPFRGRLSLAVELVTDAHEHEADEYEQYGDHRVTVLLI